MPPVTFDSCLLRPRCEPCVRVRDVAVDGVRGLCARRFYNERGVGDSTDRQFSRRVSVQRATRDSR